MNSDVFYEKMDAVMDSADPAISADLADWLNQGIAEGGIRAKVFTRNPWFAKFLKVTDAYATPEEDTDE